MSLRVGLIGHGAIGSVIAADLQDGKVQGVELAGVVTRSGDGPMAVSDLDALVSVSDIVVEVAGQEAVRDHAATVLTAGTDLVVTSVGALVDDELRKVLFELAETDGGGRLLLCSGAIGGLELLRAVGRLGPIDEVTLTTTKQPGSLGESWMDPAMLARLDAGDGFIVFDGTAREAAARFPRSLNVAATLVLTTVGLDDTRVVLVADPDVTVNTHRIHVSGTAGSYTFTIANNPSPANPRSSGITPHAVLRLLADLTSPVVVGI